MRTVYSIYYNFFRQFSIVSILLFVLSSSVYASHTSEIASENLDKMDFDVVFNLVLNYLGDAEEFHAAEIEDLYEDLHRVYNSPINWNGATQQQFEQLYFVDDIHIEELLYYSEQLGPVRSISELKLVENIDKALLLLLPSFIYVGERNDSTVWSDAFKYPNHRVVARIDYTPELRSGFRSGDDAPLNPYLGSNFRPILKYQFTAEDKFRCGAAVESDYGEPFAGRYGRGFDLYRMFAEFNDYKFVKRAVVGSYKANFGSGLLYGRPRYGNLLSQSLSFNSVPTLQGYGGISELPTMQGVATNLEFGKLNCTILYGFYQFDADTTGASWHSLSSGYHRTESELMRRNTVDIHSAGIHLSYQIGDFALGASASGAMFSLPAVKSSSKWNAYDFSGKYQWGVSVDYAYTTRKVSFSGETALSQNIAVATTNTLQFHIQSDIDISLNYRYFSPMYYQFWSSTFSSSSDVNAEKGATLSFRIPIARGVKLSALANLYKPLYPSIYNPSELAYEFRADLLASLSYTSLLSAYIRYRLSPSWYADATSHTKQVELIPIASLYLKYSKKFNQFAIVSHFQMNMIQSSETILVNNSLDRLKFGWLLAQDFSYNPHNIPLHLRLRVACYGAPTYDNRFYLYESDVPESGYSPALYGAALRWYVVGRYNFKYGVSLSIKAAQTLYADRNKIGSGNDCIYSWHRTDLHCYLSWRFGRYLFK